MKVTVWDVTNNKVNVRDYMSVDEETGRIYVDGLKLETVLIDKTAEWDELKQKNKRYREAIDKIKECVNEHLSDGTEINPYKIDDIVDVLGGTE